MQLHRCPEWQERTWPDWRVWLVKTWGRYMWASLVPSVTYSFTRLVLCNAISWECAGQVTDECDMVLPLRTVRLRIIITHKAQLKYQEYSGALQKRKPGKEGRGETRRAVFGFEAWAIGGICRAYLKCQRLASLGTKGFLSWSDPI